MKKLVCFLTIISLAACQKDNTIAPGTSTATIATIPTGQVNSIFNTSGQTLLLSGTFESNAHSTKGSAKIYEDKSNKRTLVVEGYKGDPGPDLRIYMAEDTKAKNFVEISDKVVTTGDFVVVLPASVDVSKQKFVLIWCKQFAVLFGNAPLK